MEKALQLVEQLIEFSKIQDMINPPLDTGGIITTESFFTFHLQRLKDLIKEGDCYEDGQL